MKRLICLCNLVEENEIISVLKKGAASLPELQRYTGAGTSCGRCHAEISYLLSAFQKEKPKDSQQQLDFGF
jgi:bacterioferritin-associated ferredoxin